MVACLFTSVCQNYYPHQLDQIFAAACLSPCSVDVLERASEIGQSVRSDKSRRPMFTGRSAVLRVVQVRRSSLEQRNEALIQRAVNQRLRPLYAQLRGPLFSFVFVPSSQLLPIQVLFTHLCFLLKESRMCSAQF